MRIRLILTIALLIILQNSSIMANQITAHNFTLPLLNGNELNLASMKGRVILVINTASQCGFVSQLKPLENMYQKYKPYGLEVIAIPSNEFRQQEPLSNEQLKNFFFNQHKVTFTVTQKLTVHGENSKPFMKWLNKEAGMLGQAKWNFYKYIIDKDGQLIDWFSSLTPPDSPKIIKVIEKELGYTK